MPLYEYKCANCGKKFEVIQKFSDAPLTKHEECGSGPVERLISVSALQFKGSGWYVNDYAKNGGGIWLQYGAGKRKAKWGRQPSVMLWVGRLERSPRAATRKLSPFRCSLEQIFHVGRLTIPAAQAYIEPLGRAAA